MPTRHHVNVSTVPHLGGKWAVILFVITLFAFVAESQLTQYVQTTLQYRQPFFIFYIVHSSFAIIFPMHLLYLMATSKYSANALINGLLVAVTDHLVSPLEPETETETMGGMPSSLQRFPTYRFMRLVFALTVGITCPSLLWFAAISLASISDVTALWNTSPFFVYIITVKMFHLKWEPRRMMAVSLAILGTIGVLYGGSTSTSSSGDGDIDIAANTEIEIEARTTRMAKPTAPLVGDILIVVASVGYAFYQVLYKKYAALPSDPEVASEGMYESISASSEGSSDGLYNETAMDSEMDDVPPPPPPFGFHPNMLTSSIGLCTFIILWIPIPILHYFDLEPFRFPANSLTVIAIAGIAFTGVIFNAGFMILLGAWGPIITSVGNLLTIVLVFFSDVLFGAGIEAVNVWGLVGSTVIVAAFAVLAYDMFRGR